MAENACSPKATGAPFSLARLDVTGGPETDGFAKVAAELLRPSDILGTYGPDAWEILLRRTAPGEASGALAPLLERLEQLGAEPRAAFAHFPADGQTAHAPHREGLRPPAPGRGQRCHRPA